MEVPLFCFISFFCYLGPHGPAKRHEPGMQNRFAEACDPVPRRTQTCLLDLLHTSPHDCFHSRIKTQLGLPHTAGVGRVAFVHAIFNFAVDGDLHCVGDWHCSQAGRAAGKLRQPVWSVLGAGVWPGQSQHDLQRLVVFADSGLSGDFNIVVHRP